MIDITHKSNTLRTATAQAIVVTSSQETVDAVKNKTVPKGDVLEIARAAGLFAVKRTSDMIPDCHPLPIEFTGINYEINGLQIKVIVNVKTIYKTGVEVEAMHGASVVALTIYDMLKPIDKGIEIHAIKLLEKKGGKSDFKNITGKGLKAAVVVCSDSVSKGDKEDKSGNYIREKLEALGVAVEDYSVIPDDAILIRQKAIGLSDSHIDLIIFTGGTGLSGRDLTPETILPIIDREISGIMEAARSYGQQRIPMAMLSRGIAGVKGKSLILTFPGSLNAVKEYMDALFPHILHVFSIMEGEGH
jgi:cyclic pyranopterin monophosphate synthase